MDNQLSTIESKKINTGKIGFILSLVSLAVSLLLLIQPIFFIFVFLMLPPLTLCLLILFSFCFCLYALIRNRGRKLAAAGLFINITTIILLSFLFITFTPPGSMPYPLNICKFKRACPEAVFWLDFDKEHMDEVQSQYTVIINKFGAVSFYTKDSPFYQPKTIIEYAEENGWKYHFKIKLTQNDFENYHKNTFSEFENLAVDCIWYIQSYTRKPFAFEEDCDVLIFETGNVHGIASYILISNDKSKMEVRFTSPALPDSGYKFWVPDQFTELQQIQFPKKEIK